MQRSQGSESCTHNRDRQSNERGTEMSEKKPLYTKGPWRKCGGRVAQYVAVHSEDGYIVLSMADHVTDCEHDQPIEAPTYPTQWANAILIAASPELFEQGRGLEDVFDDVCKQCGSKSGCQRCNVYHFKQLIESLETEIMGE